MDDNKKIYSETEMYEYLVGCVKTAKLFNMNFNINTALKNYRGRLVHEIEITIHSICLELKIQTLKYLNLNFKDINKRLKAEFK